MLIFLGAFLALKTSLNFDIFVKKFLMQNSVLFRVRSIKNKFFCADLFRRILA